MSVRLQVDETTLKRFNVGRSSSSRVFTETMLLPARSQRFSINFLLLSRQEDTVFSGNFILFLELIKLKRNELQPH